MNKIAIILFIVATVSFVTALKLYKANKKYRREVKKHKCNIGNRFCDNKCCYYCEYKLCEIRCKSNPFVCGQAKEEFHDR